MNIKVVVSKFLVVSLMSLGLLACSIPFVDPIFPDQKEDYKKAHELPPLELPPKLSAQPKKDEYDGGTKIRSVAPAPVDAGAVQAEPVVTSKSNVKWVESGSNGHIFVSDSMRNAWRQVVDALELLNYGVEDVSREEKLIYLNVNEGEGNSGMLSSLAFWSDDSTTVTTYLISFDEYSDGISVEVKDEDGELVNNESSKQIYTDLLSKLVP